MTGEEDVADPAALREELVRQRSKLETLARINDVIRDVDRAAVRATTREELEREVCAVLTDSEPYVFAWIGEQDPATKELRPRASGGEEAGYLEAIEVTVDDDATGRGPAGRAARTGELQVAADVTEDPDFEPWREPALQRGFRSVAGVPLQYDGTLYGVLTLYADRPHAFDERERTVLAELGETVGLAISALERRRALIADTVLEAVVEFADPDHPLVRATTETGARVSLEGIVSRSADDFVFYHSATGADPAELAAVAAEHPRVHRARVVDDAPGRALVEFVVTGPTLATTLSEYGGTMVDLTVGDGSGQVTAQFPHGTELRSVVEALSETVDGVELAAQRTADRTARTDRWFGAEVAERLTDRQLAALRTAYFAGYHDRPRTSSGEEVADTLGVSPSTFHQHHRVGVRKLLAAAFDGGETE